jgi:hypothetical protein
LVASNPEAPPSSIATLHLLRGLDQEAQLLGGMMISDGDVDSISDK